MTTGIGNPDWQRRYAFSAVPLYSALFAVAGTVASPVIDANGFTSILLTSQAGATTAFIHLTVFWYQDAAGTILIANTDAVTTPGGTQSFSFPALARYYKVQTSNVGGGTTGTTLILTYGTINDNQNLLTQNTDVRQIGGNSATGAGATYTLAATGTYGGQATIMFVDDGNNKWFGTAEYYDWPSASWLRFLFIIGADHGQSWVQDVQVPYAPVRLNITNQDTVAHGMYLSMVCQ